MGKVGKKKEKTKKKDEGAKKGKKKKIRHKTEKEEADEQEMTLHQNRKRETQQRMNERQSLSGTVDLDVVEPAALETMDIFDSLPDDDGEDEEVISDGVASMMQGKKLVGGILRPEDMPLGK